MNSKDKTRLFIDLCAKYPYGIFVKLDNDKILCVDDIKFYRGDYILTLKNEERSFIGIDIDRVKPYLRSMSSMTDDEKKEYLSTFEDVELSNGTRLTYQSHNSIDWLNANHFDFRELIPDGIAIEALPKMYK